MAFHFQKYSFLNILQGSPSFNLMMKLLGERIRDRALLYPHRLYEFSFITISDKVIVILSYILGHYAVYGDLTIGPSLVSGVVQEVIIASSTLPMDEESGPFRAFVGSCK